MMETDHVNGHEEVDSKIPENTGVVAVATAKEKVVYKVVHVPYYYPVPVDADYYYQNQDRFLRHRERFDEKLFDHLPPPHSYHHQHHHRRSRDNSYREVYPHSYRLSRSPSPRLTESHFMRSPSSTPPHVKEKTVESPSKETVDNQRSITNGESHGKEACRVTDIVSEVKIEKQSDGEAKDDERKKNSDEMANEERNKSRRKRYLMTFPYDQKTKDANDSGGRFKSMFESGRKKMRHDGLDLENELPIEIENRRYHDFAHKRGSGHYYRTRPSSPPPTPYVMVPMRPVGVPSPDYIHDRHYKSEHPDFRAGKRRDIETDKESEEMNNEKLNEDDDEQESKDIRYHSNGRRVRTVFSRQQLLTLNNVFQKHPFVSGERMSELSKQLGLDRKIVKIWFQNKRQNARKKGSLFERADDFYYEYHQDQFSNRSSPPTMAENW